MAALVTLALTTATAGWLAFASVQPGSVISRGPSTQTPSGRSLDVDDRFSSPLERQIQVSIEERDWPDFSVPLEDLESSKATEWTSDACIDVKEDDIDRCTYDGPGDKRAVVLGDSVAVSWMPAVRSALGERGYETVSLTMGQCPAPHSEVQSNDEREGFSSACQNYQQWSAEVIRAQDPDLIIASSAENSLKRLVSESSGDEAEIEWRDDTTELLNAVAVSGTKVILLSPPPEGRNLQGCITRFNTPSDCTSTVSDTWKTQSAAEREAVERFGEPDQVRYVDTRTWFCNPTGLCPTQVGPIPIRADGNHLTEEYARYIAPQLDASIEEEQFLEDS